MPRALPSPHFSALLLEANTACWGRSPLHFAHVTSSGCPFSLLPLETSAPSWSSEGWWLGQAGSSGVAVEQDKAKGPQGWKSRNNGLGFINSENQHLQKPVQQLYKPVLSPELAGWLCKELHGW